MKLMQCKRVFLCGCLHTLIAEVLIEVSLLFICTPQIDEQWRYVITVFALSFFLCWILFAALWFLVAHAHGDLNFDPVTGARRRDGLVPCVEGAYNFIGFLLFSIETQVCILGKMRGLYPYIAYCRMYVRIGFHWVWRKISERRMSGSDFSNGRPNCNRNRHRRSHGGYCLCKNDTAITTFFRYEI